MTFRVVYKPTGELVLDAAARYRGIERRFKAVRREWNEQHGGQTTRLMNEVGFPAIDRAFRRKVD